MTIDRAAEVKHLELANKHIAAAEQHVSAQRLLVEHLRAGGHDVAEAERLLRAFEATLAEMQVHREHILQMLESIDRGDV